MIKGKIITYSFTGTRIDFDTPFQVRLSTGKIVFTMPDPAAPGTYYLSRVKLSVPGKETEDVMGDAYLSPGEWNELVSGHLGFDGLNLPVQARPLSPAVKPYDEEAFRQMQERRRLM